jgi:hypothetical protein
LVLERLQDIYWSVKGVVLRYDCVIYVVYYGATLAMVYVSELDATAAVKITSHNTDTVEHVSIAAPDSVERVVEAVVKVLAREMGDGVDVGDEVVVKA